MKKNITLILALLALSSTAIYAKGDATTNKKQKVEKVYVLDDFDFLRKTCLEGKGENCFTIATLLAKGDADSRPDNYEAVKYFKLACKKGSADGCLKMSQCHEEGMAVPKNEAATKKYLALACKLGAEDACFKMNKDNTGL